MNPLPSSEIRALFHPSELAVPKLDPSAFKVLQGDELLLFEGSGTPTGLWGVVWMLVNTQREEPRVTGSRGYRLQRAWGCSHRISFQEGCALVR